MKTRLSLGQQFDAAVHNSVYPLALLPPGSLDAATSNAQEYYRPGRLVRALASVAISSGNRVVAGYKERVQRKESYLADVERVATAFSRLSDGTHPLASGVINKYTTTSSWTEHQITNICGDSGQNYRVEHTRPSSLHDEASQVDTRLIWVAPNKSQTGPATQEVDVAAMPPLMAMQHVTQAMSITAELLTV
jgi:hypothetical protein